MVTDIENELHKLTKAEVESRVIGEMTMERLRSLDRVAYIRFASVYRDFQDEDEFERAIASLRDGKDEDEEDKSQLPLIPDDVPRLADRGRRGRRTRVKK